MDMGSNNNTKNNNTQMGCPLRDLCLVYKNKDNSLHENIIKKSFYKTCNTIPYSKLKQGVCPMLDVLVEFYLTSYEELKSI